MSKWKVTVRQRLKYTESIEAEFYDLCKAMFFAELMLKTCKNTNIEIEKIEETEQTEETNEVEENE